MLQTASRFRTRKTRMGLVVVVVGTASLSLPISTVQYAAQDSSGPKPTDARNSRDDRMEPVVQLKRLGKAMHQFHRQHGRFPAATIVGPDGETLHSWRVALLPLLGHQELYDEYRLNEPWDSNHNKTIIPKMPSVYRNSEKHQGPTYSRWLAITGPTAVFYNDSGTQASSIHDGTSKTAMLVESRNLVPWTKPEDIVIQPRGAPRRFGGHSGDGFYVLLCDGSPCFVSKDTPKQIVQALLTRSSAEILNWDEIRRYLTFHWGSLR